LVILADTRLIDRLFVGFRRRFRFRRGWFDLKWPRNCRKPHGLGHLAPGQVVDPELSYIIASIR
jgi:hypothetical protein